jgi:Flp pilus assembly protein TadG
VKRLRVLRGQRGQALVEFAVVGIMFFVMVFGMIDLVRAVSNYNTLAQATREGTRYAIVHGSDSVDPSGPGDDLAVQDAVKKFGSGLNASQLTIQATWPDGGNAPGSHVKVSSQYSYEPMFGFFGSLSIPLTSSSTMKITY